MASSGPRLAFTPGSGGVLNQFASSPLGRMRSQPETRRAATAKVMGDVLHGSAFTSVFSTRTCCSRGTFSLMASAKFQGDAADAAHMGNSGDVISNSGMAIDVQTSFGRNE